MAGNDGGGEWAISAPGKAILHGEHAVVYGKRAVAASVDLRCYLRLNTRNTGSVELKVPDLGVLATWTVDEVCGLARVCESEFTADPSEACESCLAGLTARVQTDNGVHVLACKTFLYLAASILFKERPQTPALEVQVTSSLPFASGLGSSASYSVCLVAAFLLCVGKVKPLSSSDTNTSSDSERLKQIGLDVGSDWGTASFSAADQELIRRWSFLGEKIIHGTPSGIDNAVATFGGALEFQRHVDGDQIRTIEQPPVLSILLTNTKVPRSTKKLVAGVRSWLEEMPDVAKPVMDAVDGISQQCCRYWNQLKGSDTEMQQTLYRQLGRLVDVNQSLLCCMGVSHPAIEKVCQITAASGLHSKLTGAGGGGCVMTFYTRSDVDADQLQTVKARLVENGYDVYETVLGGRGVTMHRHNQSTSNPST